jgi:hypothetical protein
VTVQEEPIGQTPPLQREIEQGSPKSWAMKFRPLIGILSQTLRQT